MKGEIITVKHNVFKRYLIITIACAVYSLGFDWCYDPNHISVGGLTGIAQIINFFLPMLPVGIMTLVMNVPLFVVGWRKLGTRAVVGSLYAMTLTSLFIDLFNALYDFQPMEPMLACLYGGVVTGLSAGFMMRENANTGGTEMAARLLQLKFKNASMGKLLLSIDLVVTIAYALVFRDITRALYGIIGLYVCSLVVDKVLYGANGAKVAHIISRKQDEITERLMKELDRGVTLLKGRGGYSGEEKEVILCAISRSEIVAMKELVYDVDPEAFVIVGDAYEILGEGFGSHGTDPF